MTDHPRSIGVPAELHVEGMGPPVANVVVRVSSAPAIVIEIDDGNSTRWTVNIDPESAAYIAGALARAAGVQFDGPEAG